MTRSQPVSNPWGGLLTALFIAEVTAAFETAMIYAALGKLISAFGDPVAVGWLVTAYLLVGAGSAAVAGRLGDLYGRRRVILILLAFGVVGSALSASTNSFGLILVGRGLQGLSAAVMPLCIGLVRDNVAPARAPLGIGIVIAGASAGTASGLIIGGLIVDHFSWHAIFYASALLSAISYVLILIFVPVSRRIAREGSIDFVGGLLFVPAVAGVLLYISNGKSWGWTSLPSLAILLVSLAMGAVWVVHSLRQADPLINVRLFGNRVILVSNLVATLVALGAQQITLVFSVLLQAPTWTGVGLGLTATAAGLVKLPSNLFALLVGPLTGILIPRFGGRAIMVAGGALCTVGWVVAAASHSSVLIVGIILCTIAFGTTVMYAVAPNLIVEAAPDDRISEALGMLIVVRQTFISIGAQVLAVIMASETVTNAAAGPGSYPSARAFLYTMGAVIGLSALATIVSLALPKHPARAAA